MTKISVIIPTFNESEVLPKCIESLGFQTETNFEIIVVDDGSKDGTPAILKNLKSALPNFSFYVQNHLGAGAARNLGARYAKGSILVFVDADMTFDKNFLKNLVQPIKEGSTKGTFSKEEFVSNWNNIWSRCWNINEGWEQKRRHPPNYPNIQPVFRAILKQKFDLIGGYTPGGYDDDWSLSKKLGYEAVNSPNAIFYHKNPSTLKEVFMHAKWVGKRKYKFGVFGRMVALIRASFPVSVCVGLYKTLVNLNASFMIFKLIYDFGVFTGILELVYLGKSAK